MGAFASGLGSRGSSARYELSREARLELAASVKELADRMARYFKTELKRAGVTCAKLPKRPLDA